jgi:hypothetical protein
VENVFLRISLRDLIKCYTSIPKLLPIVKTAIKADGLRGLRFYATLLLFYLAGLIKSVIYLKIGKGILLPFSIEKPNK